MKKFLIVIFLTSINSFLSLEVESFSYNTVKNYVTDLNVDLEKAIISLSERIDTYPIAAGAEAAKKYKSYLEKDKRFGKLILYLFDLCNIESHISKKDPRTIMEEELRKFPTKTNLYAKNSSYCVIL